MQRLVRRLSVNIKFLYDRMVLTAISNQIVIDHVTLRLNSSVMSRDIRQAMSIEMMNMVGTATIYFLIF